MCHPGSMEKSGKLEKCNAGIMFSRAASQAALGSGGQLPGKDEADCPRVTPEVPCLG